MLKLPGLELIDQRVGDLTQMMVKAKQRSIYQYPWNSLEVKLKKLGRFELLLVAYGSLVNSESAKLTLSGDSVANAEPVVAFGVKRIFNYEIPPVTGRYGSPDEPQARAALNVMVTGIIHDVTNGVLLRVPISEIPDLRRREIAYDLVPVVCLNWRDLDRPPFIAYVLQAPDRKWMGKTRVRRDITPHKEYYRLCRNAAKTIGEDFLQLWLHSTYLADGVTLISRWEQDSSRQ